MKRKELPAAVGSLIPKSAHAIEPLEDGTFFAVLTHEAIRVSEEGILDHWTWSQFASGEWDGEQRHFHATAIAEEHEDLDLVFGDEADPHIPLIISDRIESSIVYHETAFVTETGWVRVMVRRNPDGTLFTQTLGFGVDTVDPRQVTEVATALEKSVREATGMPAF